MAHVNRAPLLHLSFPALGLSWAVPMVWQDDAALGPDGRVSGWVPDYEAVAQALGDLDHYGAAETIHCALFEGNESQGEIVDYSGRGLPALAWRKVDTVREGFKLFRVRSDGTLGPLFINRAQVIEPGVSYPAEDHPTKGYAHRPGWHLAEVPMAPHLSEKGRVWARVEYVNGREVLRPECQGGTWILADALRVLEVLTPAQVDAARAQLCEVA